MVNKSTDAIFNCLSDATRRDILLRLTTGELSVGEISKAYNISLPAISKHLTVLEQANLITRERRGRRQFVNLSHSALSEASEYINNYETLLHSRLNSLADFLQREESIPPSQEETPTDSTQQEIVLTHMIRASRERVWEAYTNPEHIAQWWAPEGTTLISCTTDIRPGGTWRFEFRGRNGNLYISAGVFKEVHKFKQLTYTDGVGELDGLRPESMVTLTFEDAANGFTKLTKRVSATALTHQLQATLLRSAREELS